MQLAQTLKLLGGPRVVGVVKSPAEFDALIQSERLPTDALDYFSEYWDLSNPLVYRILPRATKARRTTLSPRHGELLARLATIAALVLALFEANKRAAQRFLLTPHPELGNLPPIERALTEIGAREVEELIQRIEHGLPA